jgi:prepilin peptidase CpaA
LKNFPHCREIQLHLDHFVPLNKLRVSTLEFVLFYICLGLSGGLFAFAAIEDFRKWKIRNRTVFALIGAYIVVAGIGLSTTDIQLAGLVDPLNDLGAAALLFAIGFVLWGLKMLGAGDAKLLFPVGLFVGWTHLLLFSIGLVVFAVVPLVGLRLPHLNLIAHTRIGLRLLEIRDTKKIPYGVVIVAALYLVIFVKFV